MFRAGEQGRFWYAVLGGSLEVRYHAPDNDSKVSQLSLIFLIFFFLNLYIIVGWGVYKKKENKFFFI